LTLNQAKFKSFKDKVPNSFNVYFKNTFITVNLNVFSLQGRDLNIIFKLKLNQV